MITPFVEKHPHTVEFKMDLRENYTRYSQATQFLFFKKKINPFSLHIYKATGKD